LAGETPANRMKNFNSRPDKPLQTIMHNIYFFWKTGTALLGSGSPSFRFYLFVNELHKTIIFTTKRIADTIRFIQPGIVERNLRRT